MMKSIVVLGGSFNPPTKAHKALLRQAMTLIHAELGLYVPSSAHYVSRKTSRQPSCVQTLSELTRAEALRRMCDTDMDICLCEYGDQSNGRTLLTLQEIQATHPDHQIWFIMGADKMQIFSRWKTCKDILQQFRIIWFSRNGRNAADQAKTIPLLANKQTHMTFLTTDPSLDQISSSLFWKTRQKDPVAAYAMLDPHTASFLRSVLHDR